MDDPTHIEMTDTLKFWLITVNCIDLAICSFTFFLCALSLYLLLKRHIFHINLILLIFNFHCHGFILTGGGIVKCVAALLDVSILEKPSVYPTSPLLLSLETVRAWSACSAVLATTLSVIERTYATLKLDSYERGTNIVVISLSILFTWLASIPCIVFCFHYGYFLCSAAFLGVNTLFSGIVFATALHLNKKWLKQSKDPKNGFFTLSERYQLRENLRVMRTMLICNRGFLICVMPGILFIASILMFTNSDSFPHRNYIIREGFHLITCLTNLVLLTCFILGTQNWKYVLKHYFCCCFCPKHNATVRHECHQDFRLTAFNIIEERDIHFRHLQIVWN